MLTKSHFLKFIQCKKYLWLAKNQPELAKESDNDDHLFRQGYEVEALAQKLFEDTVLVEGRDQKAAQQTAELIKQKQPTIFQAVAIKDGLKAIADILKYNPDTGKWDIYEVKSSTKADKNKLHYEDLSFQKVVFEGAGVEIGKCYLLHVNNKYVKEGAIDPDQLITSTDLTAEVNELIVSVAAAVPEAKDVLELEEAPGVAIVKQCSKPHPCPYIEHCWSSLPEYPIQKLYKISVDKIEALTAQGVNSIKDIPSDFSLSPKQIPQVEMVKSGQPQINVPAIKQTLTQLTYPLYFFDYESIGPAIPLYDGMRPYQQICFQYSLHVLHEDGTLEHKEYLAETGEEHPALAMLELMVENIGAVGNVIVWNKSFEIGRNEEMAAMFPQYADFLESVNERVFDLMLVFKKDYLHPEFNGSASVKQVLPVLAPDLSYKSLNINNGQSASYAWYNAVFGECENPQQVFADLREYCKLDTLAMVRIWEALNEV